MYLLYWSDEYDHLHNDNSEQYRVLYDHSLVYSQHCNTCCQLAHCNVYLCGHSPPHLPLAPTATKLVATPSVLFCPLTPTCDDLCGGRCVWVVTDHHQLHLIQQSRLLHIPSSATSTLPDCSFCCQVVKSAPSSILLRISASCAHCLSPQLEPLSPLPAESNWSDSSPCFQLLDLPFLPCSPPWPLFGSAPYSPDPQLGSAQSDHCLNSELLLHRHVWLSKPFLLFLCALHLCSPAL